MIAWFARNGVAANLLMLVILATGIHSVSSRIPLEVFPSFELDIIQISVPFRGATSEDVEEAVILRVEEAIFDLDGIKELRATAREGRATITVEVNKGIEPRNLLDDLKNRVDGISTFPAETDRPVYSVATRQREVISVAVSGDLSERELREYGQGVRDDLTSLQGVTQVVLEATRPYEIAVEVGDEVLHQYGITFADVVAAIRRASLDLSAGSIRAAGGEVLLRTKEQAYVADDFSRIQVHSRLDGTLLTLADIASVRDGFEENRIDARFNGQPAVMVEVYRVGNQNAIDVADKVKAYVAGAADRFPPGVTLVRFSVAIWVCMGIPIAFAGALALLPWLGVSINIVSLFAFILVLGVVVDDAIVTGENIYTRLEAGEPADKAVVTGTLEVAVPVTFGVLTTVAAFIPLLLIEGARGQIFAQIPLIVIPVLLFSLVESKLILPAHLRHISVRDDGRLTRLQQHVANGLERAIVGVYEPVLAVALRQRYLTLSVFVGVAVIVAAMVRAGHINFVFFPRVQSETARVTLIMPPGTGVISI